MSTLRLLLISNCNDCQRIEDVLAHSFEKPVITQIGGREEFEAVPEHAQFNPQVVDGFLKAVSTDKTLP